MKSFGEHRKECICYEGAFALGLYVIFSDRKLTSPFIRPYAANPAVSFRTASACLCGCFFAVVSPGDGCAYVGGYQPTAILQLSVELVRITGVCGPFICSAGSIFSPGPRLRENYLSKKNVNLYREYLESLSLLSVRGLWKSQKACLRDNSLSSEITVKGQQYLRGGKMSFLKANGSYLTGMFHVEVRELSFIQVHLKLELAKDRVFAA